jgi:hypothetical protein
MQNPAVSNPIKDQLLGHTSWPTYNIGKRTNLAASVTALRLSASDAFHKTFATFTKFNQDLARSQ